MTDMKKNNNSIEDRPELWKEYHKGMDKDSLKLSYKNHLKYTQAKDVYSATDLDRYFSFASSIKDRLVERWINTQQGYYYEDVKRVYYLSLEFLLGRALKNNILNMKLLPETLLALSEMNLDFGKIEDMETDAGLGNGGLGRLAACFLDSMATLGIAGYGYGIHYEFGIFNQKIKNGYQVEEPDEWLRFGNPWEIPRPEYSQEVNFYGQVKMDFDDKGHRVFHWIEPKSVLAVPYDMPIIGYNNQTVNTLRLWAAKASKGFDLKIFNHGDYVKAVENKNLSENISKVLYPNDNVYEGKELRFKQQYFFVRASLADIIRRFKKTNSDFRRFPEKVAIQLNDTHPALVVPELMRVLLDEENIQWNEAMDITVKSCGYTNHTILTEALEKWPVTLFENILPRHMLIVYEMNKKFLNKIKTESNVSEDVIGDISLIEEGPEKQVKMANLAVVGSHSINGVAELHTEILKNDVLKNFYNIFPERFNNKTNGITQRRWLMLCNPLLANYLNEKIGDEWITNLNEIKKIEKFVDNKPFLNKILEIKYLNKKHLSDFLEKYMGVKLNPDFIFDSHIKRFHEYKRQLLNALHILILANRLKNDKNLDFNPRTYIFSGKSAPGYLRAKLIIKFINSLAEYIDNDDTLSEKIKIVFIPNYGVTVAEQIIPATDVSEQISTAGKEASGTGNMKFALNGALTIGTLDGANIEIQENVGTENIFIFGKTAEEIQKMRIDKSYDPRHIYENDEEIKFALNQLLSGELSNGDKELFKPIFNSLIYGEEGNPADEYFLLADLHDYIDMQLKINETYHDRYKWAKMAVYNIANMGFFSSDRAILEYARDIWQVEIPKEK